MKAGRPSASKKNLTIDDMDDGMVGMHIRVPRELRYTIKEAALSQRRTVQDVALQVLQKEFGVEGKTIERK